jgi:hypothetical protein
MKIRKSLLLAISLLPNYSALYAAIDPPDADRDQEPARLKNGEKKIRSSEWTLFPTQTWEYSQVKQSVLSVDKDFFDLSSVAVPKLNLFLQPSYIVSPRKLDPLGILTGSRSESKTLFTGDTVTIRAAGDSLQIGETYAIITEDPIHMRRESTRRGFVYPILGKVKMTDVHEHLYIGTITEIKRPLGRGAFLTLAPAKIATPRLIAGPQPLKGMVILDPNENTATLAQHKEVFIDRGSEDDIQPGMIFRIFQTEDPVNQKSLGQSRFAIDADLLVTQVTDTLSAAIVLTSYRALKEGSEATLLTDLTGLNNKTETSIKGTDAIDELDQLDRKKVINSKDAKVLNQLEKWKGPAAEDPTLQDPNQNNLPVPYGLPPAPPENQQAGPSLPPGAENYTTSEHSTTPLPPPSSEKQQSEAPLPLGSTNEVPDPSSTSNKQNLPVPPPKTEANVIPPPIPAPTQETPPLKSGASISPPPLPMLNAPSTPPTAPTTEPKPPISSSEGVQPNPPETGDPLPPMPALPNS